MITHIVSDMGGVLIELQWQDRVEKLLNRPLPIDELHHLWVNARSTTEFETGMTNFEEFTTAFLNEFEVNLPPAALQQEFLEIVQAPLPNCEQVLSALKPHFHLSLLSNTNPAHYGKLRERYTFFNYFDELFLSYQVGHLKPNAAIFEHVLAALQIPAERVAFFDDGTRNVEAARDLGMQAFQVNSPDEVLAVVEGFGVELAV
jgi:putative hydrolase of the HAD superfamily